MSVESKLMTAEEYWELPEKPGVWFELVDGELVEMPGAGGVHAEIMIALLRILIPFMDERRLGRVYGDGLAFVLARDPDIVRVPDVSIVLEENVPEGGAPRGIWPGAPDIAIEIVSHYDRIAKLHRKVSDYLEAGTSIVWVVWPDEQKVSAFFTDGPGRELHADDELDGGDVLPGFRVGVADLFDVD